MKQRARGRNSIMSARSLLGILLATVALTTVAQAEDFPNRPISLVVAFAPGGLTDVPARILAPELQQRLGQPVVVENKPGASGVTGDSYVLRSAPDGYTLLISAIAEVQNLYYIHVPYNILTDFSPVAKIADGPPLVLVVNTKSELKSVADLVAYAKANPTKTNLSTTGPASSPAIAVAQLNSLAGTTMVPVPYNGSGPAATAVVSGEVQGGFVFYPSAAGFVDGGQMRVLAVAGARRLANLPNVPTMTELGFKNFQHDAFVGISAPRDTPQPVIAVLNKAVNESLASSTLQKRVEQFGMSLPAQPNTPEAFGRFMADQVAHQGDLAKLSGGLQPNH
jgi:tripartite-type tricarboxylate transporter receptor subunit TctC